MDDDFLQLGLGQALLSGSLEVAGELLGVAAGDQRGDGDQAPVSG
jgi:hypothetical protein